MLSDSWQQTVTESGEVCDLYTGECYDPNSLSRFGSLDYYRDRVREMQVSLNALDAAAQEMQRIVALPLPPAEYALAVDWLTDFDSTRSRLVTAAQAINLAADAANAVGVRMPVLSIPQRLAAVPPVAIAAVAAAIGAGAWALAYAADKIAAYRTIAQRTQMIMSLPESERAAVAAGLNRVDLAQAQASPLVQVANILKWVALGVAGWFAFRAAQDALR
jgi:hypothetical protein